MGVEVKPDSHLVGVRLREFVGLADRDTGIEIEATNPRAGPTVNNPMQRGVVEGPI